MRQLSRAPLDGGAFLYALCIFLFARFLVCPCSAPVLKNRQRMTQFLPSSSLAAACQGPEHSDAFVCSPPRCSLVGEKKSLAGSCSSPLGPVAYFDANGAQIVTVMCPARASDAVFVEPRVIVGGTCPVKGPKFSVVGECRLRFTLPGAIEQS